MGNTIAGMIDKPKSHDSPLSIRIERTASDALLEGVNRLLPQVREEAPQVDKAGLARIVSSPRIDLVTAWQDGKLVGLVTVSDYEMLGSRRALINDMVVDEPYQGQGIGRRLFQAAIDHARSTRVDVIELTSRPSREVANHLYERAGFERRETNPYRLKVVPD